MKMFVLNLITKMVGVWENTRGHTTSTGNVIVNGLCYSRADFPNGYPCDNFFYGENYCPYW